MIKLCGGTGLSGLVCARLSLGLLGPIVPSGSVQPRLIVTAQDGPVTLPQQQPQAPNPEASVLRGPTSADICLLRPEYRIKSNNKIMGPGNRQHHGTCSVLTTTGCRGGLLVSLPGRVVKTPRYRQALAGLKRTRNRGTVRLGTWERNPTCLIFSRGVKSQFLSGAVRSSCSPSRGCTYASSFGAIQVAFAQVRSTQLAIVFLIHGKCHLVSKQT